MGESGNLVEFAAARGFLFIAPILCSAVLVNREAIMKAPLLLAGALIIGCAAPAVADEYYIVQGPSRHCTITTTRPADTEVVTQIGPMAFKSRVEAEDRVKQTKVCEEGTVGSTSGTSSTTIIKEK
jgi:hypothetical protein